MTAKYGARVVFADGYTDLHHASDGPDKVRIEALQKAKLTGHEPSHIFWDDEDGPKVMLWPTQERMTVQEYGRQTGLGAIDPGIESC